MTLTPFQKRLSLILASSVAVGFAQAFPAYAGLIQSLAGLLLGVTIPGPDTSHTITVAGGTVSPKGLLVPSIPPQPLIVVSGVDQEGK